MMKTHVDLNTSGGAGKGGSGETNQCNHRRRTSDPKKQRQHGGKPAGGKKTEIQNESKGNSAQKTETLTFTCCSDLYCVQPRGMSAGANKGLITIKEAWLMCVCVHTESATTPEH